MSHPLIEDKEPAAQQPDFFDDGSYGVELAGLAETKHGKYTGQELERRLSVRDAVVRLLAQGVGIRRIATTMRQNGIKIGEHSILALRDRRADLVATEKKQLSQQLGRIAKMAADSIEERIIAGTMKPTSVDLAIFIDKKAALDGDASFIVEHRHTVDASAESFAAKLEQMKRVKVLDVQTVDLQSSELPSKP